MMRRIKPGDQCDQRYTQEKDEGSPGQQVLSKSIKHKVFHREHGKATEYDADKSSKQRYYYNGCDDQEEGFKEHPDHMSYSTSGTAGYGRLLRQKRSWRASRLFGQTPLLFHPTAGQILLLLYPIFLPWS